MKNILFLLFISFIFLSSCSKDDDITSIKKDTITGFVQKGPFNNGTSITINELDADLSQTGKTYNTQIVNSQGSFEINNIELVSNYASFRADGFYFNEILGEQSTSQITLYALSDISDKSNVNVNVLSHLEKARVEYLISHGSDFQDAKIQALGEILDVFKFNLNIKGSSEFLNIAKDGDSNAILLASSLILQGYRTEGELTELLSNISTDLKEDGVLNNTILGSQMMNHAVFLDTAAIRNNLENRYSELGIEVNIPNFEKYIKRFIDSADFEITQSLIEYPQDGLYGQNILDLSRTTYSGSEFSLAANLPNGTKLKIKITALGAGMWYYAVNSVNNWSITRFDEVAKSQYFTAIESDRSCDLEMLFDTGEFIVEYFEMDSDIPTRIKTIKR